MEKINSKSFLRLFDQKQKREIVFSFWPAAKGERFSQMIWKARIFLDGKFRELSRFFQKVFNANDVSEKWNDNVYFAISKKDKTEFQ